MKLTDTESKIILLINQLPESKRTCVYLSAKLERDYCHINRIINALKRKGILSSYAFAAGITGKQGTMKYLKLKEVAAFEFAKEKLEGGENNGEH